VGRGEWVEDVGGAFFDEDKERDRADEGRWWLMQVNLAADSVRLIARCDGKIEVGSERRIRGG